MSNHWNTELQSIIKTLRETLIRNTESLGSLRDIAIRTNGLPVYYDMSGCLIITPEGEVVMFDSKEEKFFPIKDTLRKNIAYMNAAEKYSELHVLYPIKPNEALDCEVCSGSGKIINGQLSCRRCYGLGWIVLESS